MELNSRSFEELANTKGIGKSKATALVEYRDHFGPFESIEELFQVKGFGAAFFKRLEEAGELADVKKKTSKGLETIQELLKHSNKEVSTFHFNSLCGFRKKCFYPLPLPHRRDFVLGLSTPLEILM